MMDIEAIRQRAEKATPGPWFWNSYNGIFSEVCRVTGKFTPGVFVQDGKEYPCNGCPHGSDLNHDDYCTPVVAWIEDMPGYASGGDQLVHPEAMANAEFIEHSREDIPTLLAEIDRLRALLPNQE